MSGYVDHYHKAKQEFVDWYYKGHPDKEMSSFWFTNCYNIDDMLMYDDELKFALEAFEDDQVKLIYHYEIDEHCLKIKWEVNPWWPKQLLHFYYSILLPIDGIDFKFPHELVQDGEE
jgi:hypothetical protein